MPNNTFKSEFDEQGFVIVRQFLAGEDLYRLGTELDRYIREVVPRLAVGDAFYEDRNRPETLRQMQNMGSRDAFFESYRREPRWQGLARELLGEACTALEPEWFNKTPGILHPTPPHQDNFYFCLTPPRVLTMWLALDEVDEENGALRYVAGSHARGIRPHGPTEILGFSQGILDYGPADREQEVLILMQPGDLVIHHGNTIHRAEPNHSAHRQRRAFAMVFAGDSCRQDPAAYARYQDAVQSQHQRLGLVPKS